MAIDDNLGARDHSTVNRVYPPDKPDVPTRSYPINVRFVLAKEIRFPIKNMSAANFFQGLMPNLSLFEIAGRIEMPTAFSVKALCQTAFSSQPEKIQVNMKSVLSKKNTETKKRASKAEGDDFSPQKPNNNSAKATEFQLQAPQAGSVKLAADFTGWEKAPLEMSKDEKGNWTAQVELAPGEYAYRFIVDGEWFDDPFSFQTLPNPFGSKNAVKRVH